MKKSSYEYNTKFNKILNILLIIISTSEIISGIIAKDRNLLEIAIYPVGIIFGINNISRIINKQKTYRKVIEKGIKVPGVIARPEKEKTFVGEGWETSYYLYVKYVDPKTNQEVEFKTEALSFNPFKKLKSTKCNVYIHNDIIIAEDFELTKNKNERVFQKSDIVKQKTEIKSGKLLTVLAIIMIVIATIIFICTILKKI